MSEKIKAAIVGYGNLGKGVERAIAASGDFELKAVVSRRGDIKPGAPVVPVSDIGNSRADWDVCILCGGSATDLTAQGPMFSALYNTVDSFDTHAKIPEYYAQMDDSAKKAGTLSIISAGWDPGLFSLQRMYAESVLPEGHTETFWGKGVSQGHSDALRRIEGVKRAVQYTVPKDNAVAAARRGDRGLTLREKHLRDCYIVAEKNADKLKIEEIILNMPYYFAGYDTAVHFIGEEEFIADHAVMPHGGFVIRNGETAGGESHTLEYSIKLESNPSFTASVLVAYARAAVRLSAAGQTGARTVFDIPPAMISPLSGEELRKNLL